MLRINKSYLIAAGLSAALALWLLSGRLASDPPAPGAQSASANAAQSKPEAVNMTVQVREQHAEPVLRELILQGHTQPDRQVDVRAETSGKVIEIAARRGQRVAAGELVLRLAPDDRPARLKQAQALLNQHQRDYEAKRKMGAKGLQAQTLVNEALTNLEQAKAQLEQIELDIERTAVRAPFDGILNERAVEIGDYVDKNNILFTVVDSDPVVVAAQLPQHSLHQVTPGLRGSVRLITGEQLEGSVRYVSATAAAATRTFAIELELPNPDANIAAGLSAEIRLPVETVSTHFISPALLTLDAAGELGVNTVEDDNRVAFHPVAIVRTSATGVWVSGLPETAQIITAGQGFVQAGEQVDVVRETAAAPSDDSRVAAPLADALAQTGLAAHR